MERNFIFNIPLVQFGYFTGRRLITFKPDFKKSIQYNAATLTHAKPAGLAHYELAEKKRKPIDVCYEIGFENLSHFSMYLRNDSAIRLEHWDGNNDS